MTLLSGPRRLADHLIGHGGAVRAAVGVVPARLHRVLVDDGHPAVGTGESVLTVAHRLRIGARAGGLHRRRAVGAAEGLVAVNNLDGRIDDRRLTVGAHAAMTSYSHGLDLLWSAPGICRRRWRP